MTLVVQFPTPALAVGVRLGGFYVEEFLMPRPYRAMPADFPVYAAREGNLRLRKRFNANGITIERWRRELGVRYAPVKHAPKTVKRMKARKLRRIMLPSVNERIEDLDDFDAGACVRAGRYGWD